ESDVCSSDLILGIVNTLVLSILERTRELGLMRAVGATRRQIRTIVRRESVLMAMLGAVTGVGLGALSGVALSRALTEEGITTVAVPSTQLLLHLVIAAAIGVLAAPRPARRASRVDPLPAPPLQSRGPAYGHGPGLTPRRSPLDTDGEHDDHPHHRHIITGDHDGTADHPHPAAHPTRHRRCLNRHGFSAALIRAAARG